MKTKIYITHEDNIKYFRGTLPTWRHNFCYISRVVKLGEDPQGIYDGYGEYGTIRHKWKRITVVGNVNAVMEIK